MLHITIPVMELYDEVKQEFVTIKGCNLSLEHSLVSLAKWEAKYNRPFLTNKDDKTVEESLDYIRFMTITQNVDPRVYEYMSMDNVNKVYEYINLPMTATTIPEQKKKGGKSEIVTAELIYYWMISLQIPFECQKWHLNRLIMLIQVCSFKNQPPKKHSKRDIMSRNTALNAARRKQLGTRG